MRAGVKESTRFVSILYNTFLLIKIPVKNFPNKTYIAISKKCYLC